MSVKVLRFANGCIPFGSVAPFIQTDKRREFLDKVADIFEPCDKDSLQVGASESNCDPKFKNLHSYNNEAKLLKSSSPPGVAIASSVHKKNLSLVNSDNTPIDSRVFYNSSCNVELSDDADVKVKSPICFTPPKTLSKQKFVVNFALEPVGYQFDPLQEVSPESNVEYGLDSFYKLESIGIKDVDSPSYDMEQVEKFSKSIFLKDGHYHVELPWKKDMIEKVPSNLKVSLAVAERVYAKLENQNFVEAYEDVFNQQEALGIIEPIEKRVPSQIWIPHRPVIRVDEHNTTKIHPVFNCSLKIESLLL